MRRDKQVPAGPDTSFQIPAADLVTDPSPPSVQLRAELEEFAALVDLAGALQEELGKRALRLIEGLTQMLAQGEQDPDLEAQIVQIVQNLPLIHQLTQNRPLHYDHDDINIPPDPGDKSSYQHARANCAKLGQGGLPELLSSWGFSDPDNVICKHGARRIQEAVQFILSRPPGSVKNLGGYLRTLLETAPAAPPAKRTGLDRYLGGKYGHIVEH